MFLRGILIAAVPGESDELHLDGGSSSDRIWGESGNNTCYGQGGDDYFHARNTLADSVFGGTGTDHAQIDSGIDSMASVENLLP